MALTFNKISDRVDATSAAILPAYWANNNPPNWPLTGNSQNGRYVCGMFNATSYSPGYLLDCSTRPPTLVWKANTDLGSTDIGTETFAQIIAVDDNGMVLADVANNDGRIIGYNSSGVPSVVHTWSDANGKENGLTAKFIFALTTSDGTKKVVMIAGGTAGHDNSLIWVGTKGTTALTSFDTGGTWVAWQALIDDHDDIWIAGSDTNTDGTALHMWRLTNTSSPYNGSFSVDMGANGRNSFGYFKNGHYVGAWGDTTANAIFSVDLTAGTVATDTSDASPWTGVPFGNSEPPTAPITVPPNPTSFFLPSAADSTRRTMSEILPGLVGGATWVLDQWDAGDGAVAGYDANTTVGNPIYLDGQQAFAGVRSYVDPAFPDSNIDVGDFFIYYFAGVDVARPDGVGDGLIDTSVIMRCWGFSLDGHDFYVLRLGPSETLVYDLTTGSWSEWQSPGRTNWRAHIGQNWIGMTQTLNDGFGSDVVAGDDASGVLWILDPTTGRDDRYNSGSDYITRVVTGGISVVGRDSIACNAVQMDLALGDPTQLGAAVTLQTSDDMGQSWDDQGTVTVTSGDFRQIVEWRSLGSIDAPGRVFRFADNGASVRINSCDLR